MILRRLLQLHGNGIEIIRMVMKHRKFIKKTTSFCEMVLSKIFSFRKTVCLVFIHGMDAQNILYRIVKGHSGIF